ncbi:MAG TPA: tetratricopeptide repeat protein [Candidatus Dormibacteraeota bacterium]|nr:tetratricopeptide repeat protein [Candidatus Dormibacteraeota bacterium]
MKSFRDFAPKKKWLAGSVALAAIAMGFVVTAEGELPNWISNIEATTELERAFFRSMPLPYGDVLFRRPPAETRPELNSLIQQKPASADLYALRALEEERLLDFVNAEKDWKTYSDKAGNKSAAQWDLADFYHRRLRPQDEIATLRLIGTSPSNPTEKFTSASEQSSWKAFERILGIIQSQALGKEPTIATYRDWLMRYPKQDDVYARFLDYFLSQKEFDTAKQLIANHQKEFPNDDIFPVKAEALVEYKKGSIQQGLAVYEKSFQPLWQPELVKSYFDLLAQTQSLRKFLDESRAALNKNPEDLKATARVFYYYQQQGKMDAAEQSITSLRLHKEAVNSAWTPQELYTCGRLLEEIHAYPEAARYYFALYNSKGVADSQERALTRLTDMLLTAPEMPIRLGTGELSMYKDIATMDQGPGYLNGILSLILNTTSPEYAYPEEEQRAISYFHRSRAAELLTMLDKNFPNSEGRASLHAKLLDFYAENAQSEAALKGGKEFLTSFPKSEERTHVALLMADADARLNKTQDEFAIYDAILQELATQADKMPLGEHFEENSRFNPVRGTGRFEENVPSFNENEETPREQEVSSAEAPANNPALQVNRVENTSERGPRSPEYSRVLERYLARLVELKEVPRALGVLRREIDHNPDDPGLYERLASFLQQNNLTSEQEEVYRRAFAQFADTSWYSKLARFYLRYRKYQEMEKLTQDAVKQFEGSELQKYFSSVYGGTPVMEMRLNQYANARFPHNSFFIRNLLSAYHSKPTYDHAAWLQLLRSHWFEETDLRGMYFEYLSASGELERELSVLSQAPSGASIDEFAKKNPAAVMELAQAQVWRSHFEESAPAFKALAEIYPSQRELDRTASSIYRSLAYFDGSKTAVAVKIEENLLAKNPGDTEILARIGDIYSDRELFAQASPYWERIPKAAPGESAGYLEAATIYWDYFDFENALRLLDEGRKKLNNPALYGYEEGAIYETKHDYDRAIREYSAAAVASGTDSPALLRLLELARRPKFRDAINSATVKLTVDSSYSQAAINLRVRVLETQNNKQSLTAFLAAAVEHAATIEQAAELESMAQQRSLESVRERALEKQADLANDPVTRLQLRYALVRFYEDKKDFSGAQRNIEALYRSNPKILGVVRATADFYWRTKQYPLAITVLRQAAKDAYPQLGKQFTFEAARKSTEARDFQQARTLLDALLKDSPYDSTYLAAMADTYAQSGDAQGLKQFYLDKIALFRAAPLTVEERKPLIATLRRGLIPALTQLKDYPAAVDQYIELINNFPEDESLTSEAALYALRYQREKQLLDFYTKTIGQSPRDYRWPMALARMQSSQEDFAGAIDSYGKALTIRPDRTDLRIARATLEERLQRFDDAASDYERLYQLAYKDPKWMEKLAEVRARQGRTADAVAALKTALIDPGPERAGNYFEVATRLESWGMLEQAKTFAEQGLNVAGGELLATPENHQGARLFSRVMTRLRKQQEAYETLQNALKAASDTLPVLKEQVAKQGLASATDKEWREHLLATRQQNAKNGMRNALHEMGATVAQYFTPEEKATFVEFAQKLRTPMSDSAATEFAIPLVQTAGLADLETKWRFEILMTTPQSQPALSAQLSEFVQLQRQRLKFAELAAQLEQFNSHAIPQMRPSVIHMAAEAYRSAGDTENELRLLSSLGPANLGGEAEARWFSLLLKKNPQQLVQLAAVWNVYGQSAADFVIANGDAELAQAVVNARSHGRPPVWDKSYTALVGLYFAETRPTVNGAFEETLGDQTIGDRIGKPVDRNKQLAGDLWFYYGSRYGEYLDRIKQGSPDEFLAAGPEHNPTSSESYRSLGDYYLDQGNTQKAIEEYKYTLELNPDRADIHDKLALAYLKEKNRAEAVAQWKLFFAAQLNQVNKSRLPESFWSDFGAACDHVRSRALFAELKPQIDQLVRTYLRINGNYRSNAILHSAFAAQKDSTIATAWLVDVSTSAPDPVVVLQDIAEISWIPVANRGPIFQRILEGLQAGAEKKQGMEQESAKSTLRDWQIRWIGYLITTKQYTQANELLAATRKESTAKDATALVPFEMQCAAKLGTLDSVLSGYRVEPLTAPPADSLRAAARQLFESGDKQSARKILEFVFAQALEEHQLVATNFLGLAEIRLADGDVEGATTLLKRLVLVVGDPYQNQDSAAALLEKTSHFAEAIAFLEPLSKSTPWDSQVRLRLAKARLATIQNKDTVVGDLAKIAANPENSYATRVQAANVLGTLRQPRELGNVELKLLAAGPKNITAAAADQPFFYAARLAAAENSPSARAKMQILAKALADQPSRDDARLPFFHAAVSVTDDELALAALEQILHGQLFLRTSPDIPNDQEILADDESSGPEVAVEEISPSNVLSPAQQAQTAREVGLAFLRLNRPNEAVGYLQMAAKLERSPAEKKQITAHLQNARTLIRRQRENAARQPILHAELEQDHVVRPRLVAKTLKPSTAPAAAGEKP